MKKRNGRINGFNNIKLESKVMKLSPKLIKKEEGVRYIPMCVYQWHIGIIKDEDVCKIRECKNYKKFYL